MFGALFIRIQFFHINHIGNWWKCDGADGEGDDARTCCSLSWLCQRVMPGEVFKRTYYGSYCFCITVKKCQKLFKLNEFYSVTDMTLKKGAFLQNPDLFVFYSKNQVTAPCDNRLAWHVSKNRSSVSIVFFCKSYWHFKDLWRWWR